MTTIPKEYIVPARWARASIGLHELTTDGGAVIATIDIHGMRCLVRTKNRRGGWNYGSAGNVRAAKAKAKKMLAEEAV